MGEMTFIKNGIATTIDQHGNIEILEADQCDMCSQWGTDGVFIRDGSGQAMIWACLDCRTK
jgi:hypothetical protein